MRNPEAINSAQSLKDLGQKLNRRTLLRASAATYLTPIFLRIPDVSANFDGGDPSVDLGDSINKPILEGFAEMDFSTQVASVEINYSLFRQLKPEKLYSVGEESKIYSFINESRFGKPAPTFSLEGGEVRGVPHYIAHSTDSNKYLPNLGIVDLPYFTRDEATPPNNNGEEVFGFKFLAQGIFLGRTKNTLDTSVGKVDTHIGYFGMYIGDPNNDFIRFVLPVNLGFDLGNNQTFPLRSMIIGESDGQHPVTPFEATPLITLNESLVELDKYIGKASVGLELNSDQVPNKDVVQEAGQHGYPEELFTFESLMKRSQTTLNYYNDLKSITLSQAQKGGYSYYAQPVGHEPIQSPITAPILNLEETSSLIKKLPRPSSYLNHEELTLNRINLTPIVYGINIFPTSKNIYLQE